ncbi:DUF452 family protein [Campylobacter sp. MIT 21-1685]|uniref:pimeloyl-ACP methyl esterase BioG family protein n=1 Tax=unclassified Campylobacter TaxID=2593542 RepID=UPI00224AB9C5|nr:MULTISPECIES: pimeloyl-ACP methyl esterase BioG family protein [unclassified Campylobacter]MCX2683044.1 DUF452 family protein [Campylobacter sp. MIT 21-1684]MCX2751326.1 DUF452 family protein [Campylobacter sp. MIT 21-1682]MCX2807525.1 DUF452 family protein [Campylobacter sp. MIT 21-1685]
MKQEFLYRNTYCDEMILFFGGFASHPSHFSHLKTKKNVVMLYDYNDCNFDFNIPTFEKITIIAFSLGVSVASWFLKDSVYNEKITQKIAINGTNQGIDRIKGIHPAIFEKTMKNFALKNFQNMLFKEHLHKTQHFVFKKEQDLQKELENLWHCTQKNSNENCTWDKVYMSLNDEIFPNAALQKCFSAIHTIKEPHFAFFHFTYWEEI